MCVPTHTIKYSCSLASENCCSLVRAHAARGEADRPSEEVAGAGQGHCPAPLLGDWRGSSCGSRHPQPLPLAAKPGCQVSGDLGMPHLRLLEIGVQFWLCDGVEVCASALETCRRDAFRCTFNNFVALAVWKDTDQYACRGARAHAHLHTCLVSLWLRMRHGHGCRPAWP